MIAAVLFLIGCAGPRLEYTIQTPPECGNQISPNGEPENKRYTTAYEAFLWQCLKVRSVNLDERCQDTCSGTPCATAGCSDGGVTAENQINELITKYGKNRTPRYLKKLSNTKECKEKTKPYFGE